MRPSYNVSCRNVGKMNIDSGSGTGAGLHPKASGQVFHPFLHAEQSNPFFPIRVESLSIVVNSQMQSLTIVLQLYCRLFCFGMAHNIAECFLNNSIDTGLIFVG